MKTDGHPVVPLSCKGLVLRVQQAKGTNRLLSVLTAERGVLKVTAYGSGKNADAGALQLFGYSDLLLMAKQGYYRVESASSVHSFYELANIPEHFALASYMAQLLCDACPVGMPAGNYLELCLHAFDALTRKKRPHRLVKAAFELRLMCESGYMPDLSGDGESFDPMGGKLCARHIGVWMTPGAIAAMRHIAQAPVEKIFGFNVGEESLNALSAACERFVLAQSDRVYPTLSYYKQLSEFAQIVSSSVRPASDHQETT